MNLILILTVLGFAIGAWFLLLAYEDTYGLPDFLFWDLTGFLALKRSTPHSRLKKKYKRMRRFKTHTKVARHAYNSPRLAGNWHQILIMVRHDVPTAERLVKYTKNNHPGRSDKWVLEKVLWDLERDRF